MKCRSQAQPTLFDHSENSLGLNHGEHGGALRDVLEFSLCASVLTEVNPPSHETFAGRLIFSLIEFFHKQLRPCERVAFFYHRFSTPPLYDSVHDFPSLSRFPDFA